MANIDSPRNKIISSTASVSSTSISTITPASSASASASSSISSASMLGNSGTISNTPAGDNNNSATSLLPLLAILGTFLLILFLAVIYRFTAARRRSTNVHPDSESGWLAVPHAPSSPEFPESPKPNAREIWRETAAAMKANSRKSGVEIERGLGLQGQQFPQTETPRMSYYENWIGNSTGTSNRSTNHPSPLIQPTNDPFPSVEELEAVACLGTFGLAAPSPNAAPRIPTSSNISGETLASRRSGERTLPDIRVPPLTHCKSRDFGAVTRQEEDRMERGDVPPPYSPSNYSSANLSPRSVRSEMPSPRSPSTTHPLLRASDESRSRWYSGRHGTHGRSGSLSPAAQSVPFPGSRSQSPNLDTNRAPVGLGYTPL